MQAWLRTTSWPLRTRTRFPTPCYLRWRKLCRRAPHRSPSIINSTTPPVSRSARPPAGAPRELECWLPRRWHCTLPHFDAQPLTLPRAPLCTRRARPFPSFPSLPKFSSTASRAASALSAPSYPRASPRLPPSLLPHAASATFPLPSHSPDRPAPDAGLPFAGVGAMPYPRLRASSTSSGSATSCRTPPLLHDGSNTFLALQPTTGS